MTANPSDHPDETIADNTRSLIVTADLSADDVYSLLADRHRRYTLYYLVFETDGKGGTLDDLIEYLRTTADAETIQERTLRTQLHHTILPRLQDYGLIDYDSRSAMTRYRGHPQLEAVLTCANQIERDNENNGQNERRDCC